ncbi:MAG TPA: V-type ATP synthase subunit E family protein [Methanoregulaceae archaeon]|nr:V-type ATP synthase subunit E family protein [Methanoregulaceae archaeon]
MGLEVVIEEIRAKEQKEADLIRQDAQQEVNSILTAAQERAEKIKLDAEHDVKKQISHIENQEISAANLVVKRQLLNTQKELLDQVYQTALQSISQLSPDFHREMLKNLLQKAVKEIAEGIVHCNERDMPALKEILVQDPALKGYSPGKTQNIEGGIIVESGDGELQIDYSYRTFLDQAWVTGLKDASGILFG